MHSYAFFMYFYAFPCFFCIFLHFYAFESKFLKDLKPRTCKSFGAFLQNFLTPLDFYLFLGTQTDSFRVLRQSFCGKFKLSAESDHQRHQLLECNTSIALWLSLVMASLNVATFRDKLGLEGLGKASFLESLQKSATYRGSPWIYKIMKLKNFRTISDVILFQSWPCVEMQRELELGEGFKEVVGRESISFTIVNHFRIFKHAGMVNRFCHDTI